MSVKGVRATATRAAVTSAAGPVLPAASTTLLASSVRVTVPTEHEATGTVYEAPDPVGAPTTQSMAVPVWVKSAASSSETDSLKARS